MSYYQRSTPFLWKRLTSCQSQRPKSVAAPATTTFHGTIHLFPTIVSSTIHTTTTTTTTTIRYKHSSRQIKRLFKKNPARLRIENKTRNSIVLNEKEEEESTIMMKMNNIPTAQFKPVLLDPPLILPNGWNPPPPDDILKNLPKYPFRVTRTKNKPNDAVGFLPVYSEYRKDGAKITTRIKGVSGDQQVFLNELRAALQIPIPNNPRDDVIGIRTGGTIEVKGNRVREVKQWLAGLGF